MTNRTAAAVELARAAQLRDFEPSLPTIKETLATAPIPPNERINELELERFQVALIPFPTFEASGRGIRDTNGGASRMVLLPMTWRQLMARVRKEVAPAAAENEIRIVRFGDVAVDLMSMEVRRSNDLVDMTALEFKVLRFFLANPNRVISRQELLDQVWGYQNYPSTRTVDNHILRLRHKLEPDFSNPVHFRTMHGVGYKFTP